MARKAFIGILIAFLIAGLSYFVFYKPPSYKHVFINETNDHRFDESIRVSILASYKRTGVQNAVFISDKVSESNIENVAAQMFHQLKLGRANNGRAILYYFNPQSRTLKIEVGHSLEGVLPDIKVKGLELAAKSFIFSDRYQDFWAELINTLNIEVQKQESRAGSGKFDYDFSQFKFLSGGAGIAAKDYSVSWEQVLSEFKQVPHENLSKYVAQSDIRSSVLLYLESLREGYSSAAMDLLSYESRLYRQITPLSSFQLYRNARMYEEAGIDQIFEWKNLAFVFFKENAPVLPLVLRRDQNVWRIQEPLSWSLFQRFEDSNRVFLKFPIEGLPKAMDMYLAKKLGNPIYALKSPLTAEFISQSPDNSWKSNLFHLYWLEKAENELSTRDASSLSDDELMLASDVHMNLGHISSFLSAYKELAQRFSRDRAIQNNWAFYQDVLAFKDADWVLKR